jgi:tryptophan synthase beta chain
MSIKAKIILEEEEIPKAWYNIQADMPELPEPPLNPMTKEPAKPEDFAPIFPMEIVRQEMTTERFIPIPEEVREVYQLWRPTPLYRAKRLEEKLKTPARIYYKWEGVSPPGSHKPNTSIPQAYYNMKEGIERLATETGAGQWGSALSFGAMLFGLKATVYMVGASYDQKPYRRVMMETWDGEVYRSPSNNTQFGKKMLAEDPNTTGSLGMAISEAVEDAATHDNVNYAIGSVLNHVCLHQTVIGLEAKKAFETIDEYPDFICGNVGGGSNFSGATFPFVADKLNGKRPDLKIVACEPMSCPTLTKGLYLYDYGDTAGMAPIIKMFTLGHTFIPPPIHAGGLRYHGDSPLLCKLVKDGYIEAAAYHQTEVFKAAKLFAETEGIIIAPESAHEVKAVVDEALRCKEEGIEEVIFFNNSGHGHFDLSSYDAFLQGKLVDYEYPAELVKQALEHLPKIK